MEQIKSLSKEYERVVLEHDPVYERFLEACHMVTTFIKEKNLILYGGLSIDYAVRLKGDKLYPENQPPDLDFYSPDNVKHAYEMADRLYDVGFTDARAINATNIGTMRNDIGDNHFVSDISYIPQGIFDKLPWIDYNGIRIIHPLFQRVDIHSSLSFPFDNAPREVIFARWQKDIDRFNLLNKHYPVEKPKEILNVGQCDIPRVFKGQILTGFAAYSALHKVVSTELESRGLTMPDGVSKSSCISNETHLTIDTLNGVIEIVSQNPEATAAALGLSNVRRYEPFINLLPPRVEGSIDGKSIVIYSCQDQLITISHLQNTRKIRMTSVQYLLKYFLSMYFYNSTEEKLANTYLDRYVSILKMMTVLDDSFPEDFILFPSVKTYGSTNINKAQSVMLNRIYHNIDNSREQFIIPFNYYPHRSRTNGRPWPEFDPNSLELMRESGLEIKNN